MSHNDIIFKDLLDLGELLTYTIESNGKTIEIDVPKDLAMGSAELPPEVKERIILRNLDVQNIKNFVFKVHGGLGDILMAIETTLCFKEYCSKNNFSPKIHLIIDSKMYSHLKDYINCLDLFSEVFFFDKITPEDEQYIINKLAATILNAGPSPIRLEHLSLGDYKNSLWATWGLPGEVESFKLTEKKKKFIEQCRQKAIKYIKKRTENNDIAIIVPLGHGLINQWKSWSDEKWNVIIDEFISNNKDIFILCDKPEQIPNIKKHKNVHLINHLVDSSFSINTLFGILDLSSITISVDTGPAHILPILNKKGIVLFGPTNPLIYGHNSNVNVRVSSCPPCYFSAQTILCQKNICMQEIDPELILNIIKNI